MRLKAEHWFQLIGGLVALGVAYGGIRLGVFAAGRRGVVVLVLSVPIGVVIGWVFIKVLEIAHRIISE